MIRQFKIYNARGDMIDLTNNGDFLAFNPQGLGVSFSNGFYGANANFLQNGLTLGQKQLELMMMFGHKSHDGYQRYFEFVKFLNHTPYLLEYETSAGVFHRECVLNELTKTELKEEGTLQESFILDFTTPYFKTVSNKTVIVPPIEGKAGKIYETVTRKRQVFESVPKSYREGDLWHWNGELGILNPTNRPGVVSGLGDELSIKNEVLNGDFSSGVNGWQVYDGTQHVVGNKNTITGNGTSNRPRTIITQPINMDANDKVYLQAKVTFLNQALNLSYYQSSAQITVVNNPVIGNVYKVGVIFTTTSNFAYRFGIAGTYADAATALNKQFTVESVLYVNLTKTFGAGNEPTKEEMDELLTLTGWFDGEKRPSGYFISTKSSNEFNFNDFVYYGQSANENTYYDKIYNYTYSFDDYPTETEESYYTYDYVYDGYEDGKDGVFVINNQSVYIDSSIGSPCQIIVRGPATNPHWQIVQGSEIVQSDGFNLDIPDGYRLVVSSIPQAQRAVLIAPDGTTSNVWQQQDFSKTNFVTFPVGQSRIIFFNCKQVEFTYREESVVI